MSTEQLTNKPERKGKVARTVLRRKITKDLAYENLCDFVEATSGYALHPWQKVLCKRLQKLATQKGQRLLIHAAPQVGKSQIVSKRFPAWMVWRRKTIRVILAAYNKSHAGGLIDAAKNAALHEVVAKEIEWVKSNADDGIFSAERLALNDAQPSLIGVGLESGYTGRNGDLLIIDDPYPNAEAARSEAYNRSVRSFWEETAEPRLLANPDANVVVMFHRYHENDIAGYLLSRYQNWEVLRFAAIADGGTDDPTKRKVGELLSPFHTLEHLQAKERDDPKTFAGQFQGKPLADGEQLFEPWMFEDRFVDPLEVPPISPWYRGVDTAFTTETYSDKTGTARLAFDPDGNLWIRGTETQKLRPGNMVDWLEGIAERESRATTWVIEQHNAGYAAVDRLKRLGFPVWSQKIQGAQGSKLQRAFVLHDLAYRRKVFIVKEGAWQELSAQLFAFTGDPKLKERDDLIDAISVVLVRLKETKSEQHRQRPNNPYLSGYDLLFGED